MAKDCGCNNTPSEPKKVLLAEAISGSASDCGNPITPASAVSECPKQEPTFDIILSSFILPVHNANIDVEVCNSLIYSIGQYFQFLLSGVIMEVVAINNGDNSITLRNSCHNGAEIESNPDAGFAIQKNSPFIVATEPPCYTEGEATEFFNQGLAASEELCAPELIESTSTSIVQIVGRVESDSGDPSIGKCIRRVLGLFFQLGSIRTPSIQTLAESDSFVSRDVVAAKTDGQFKTRKLPGEWTGTIANAKYIYAGSKTAHKPVGPAFLCSPFYKLLEEKNTAKDDSTYTPIADAATYSKDFSVAIPEITGLLNKDLQDHYYLELSIIVGVHAPTAGSLRYLEVKWNDVFAGMIGGTVNTGMNFFQTIYRTVKVLNTDTTVNLKLVAEGSGMKFYYKAEILGARI